MKAIELGRRVKDMVTGFEGISVSAHDYLNGCRRISIQPPIDKDGKVPDIETFDETQLYYVDREPAIQGQNTTGGPEKYTDRGYSDDKAAFSNE